LTLSRFLFTGSPLYLLLSADHSPLLGICLAELEIGGNVIIELRRPPKGAMIFFEKKAVFLLTSE